MTADRFDVAYRPGNQRIHRKHDRRRYAQIALYLAVGIFALAAAVAATWPHLEAVRLGYRVEELRLERDQLEKDIERYRLELHELSDPRTVERLARERLGLEPAGERVVLETPPSSSPSSGASGASGAAGLDSGGGGAPR